MFEGGYRPGRIIGRARPRPAPNAIRTAGTPGRASGEQKAANFTREIRREKELHPFDGRWLLMEARKGMRGLGARARVGLGGGGSAGRWSARGAEGDRVCPLRGGRSVASEEGVPTKAPRPRGLSAGARQPRGPRGVCRAGGSRGGPERMGGVVLSRREGRRRSPWARGRSFLRSAGWWRDRRGGRRWRQPGFRRGRGSSIR